MKYWFLWLLTGIVSVLGGFFALANPMAATLASELFAGFSFIAVGILTLLSAFADQGWKGRILSILLGLAMLFLGFSLVNHPLSGIVSLTIITAAMMLVMGVFRLILAFSAEARNLRWVLVLSGLVSLALGVMIFANFPESAAVILGIFLGVELLSSGISLIVLSLSRKSGGET
ncbi:MAG: HdeD family acid-resistance protein [Pseudorhodobacter sp.]